MPTNSATSSEYADVGLELLKNAGDGGGAHHLSWHSPIRAVISLLDGYHDIAGLPGCLASYCGWQAFGIFDMGGTLWFQTLTDFPHGVLGLTFTSLIAGVHFINVQVSFRTSSFQHYPGVIGQLAKYYKVYLNLLTILIFLVGFAIPQQFCLRDPSILKKLGIFPVNTQKPEVSKDEFQRLSFCMGIQYLEADNYQKAFPALRLASEKDPALECTASLAMGLFLLSKHSYFESSEHFEHAVLKMNNSQATNVIIASYGAGLSLIFQGRSHEGIEHLERIAETETPDGPLDQYYYGQGLVLLGVTLHNERQKNEALKYLRRAAAFEHTINNLVKVCESTEDQ